MSKASKKRAGEKKRKDKRAEKAAKAALYLSYRDQGRKKGSRRFLLKKEKGGSKVKHPFSPCGNIGCIRCYGISFTGFLDKNGNPYKMPTWMFLIWKEKNE